MRPLQPLRPLLVLCLLFALAVSVGAQAAYAEYGWQEGDLALRYPLEWDEPLPQPGDDPARSTLLLAEAFAATPDARPPETPFVRVIRLWEATAESDLAAELQTALREIGITPGGTLPATLLEREALAAQGTNAAGTLFGLGRATLLDEGEGALLIVGRAAAGRASFRTVFTVVSNSLTLGAAQTAPVPEYGVLWHTERSLADGETAFLDIGGLALAPDGTLVLADAVAGLVRLDSASGLVQSSVPFADPVQPSDIAVGADGSVYVADVACGCVRVFSGGEPQRVLRGFAEDAPRSIAILGETLYATAMQGEEAVVRRFSPEGEAMLSFELPPLEQPLLIASPGGRIFALVDNVALYGVQGETFTPLFDLDVGNIQATDAVFDADENLLVATETQGIFVYDSTGAEINRIGQPVDDVPRPGELFNPHGLAVDAEGTVFWADSDGTFGNVTAMSLAVEAGRVGLSALRPGLEVQGVFSPEEARHIWYYDAQAAETVTLTAIADEEAFNLNVALRVLQPGGGELASVDDDESGILLNPLDAQLRDLRLPRAGRYTILVERVEGEGRYRLGISAPQSIDLSNPLTERRGLLRETQPVQRWQFAGRGGQRLTITMLTQDGSLDPLLRVYDPNGNLLAENDDAEDTALGFDAQIVDLQLPFNGEYIIEAGRFDGEGSYLLRIESE